MAENVQPLVKNVTLCGFSRYGNRFHRHQLAPDRDGLGIYYAGRSAPHSRIDFAQFCAM